MRKSKKIERILLILGIIFTIFFLKETVYRNYEDNIYANLEHNNELELKRAGHWEIGPILIDDSDPTKDWNYTAFHYDWCYGNGTWSNPYIIENVSIDGGWSGSCLEIRSSNVYFITRNCTLYNSGDNIAEAGITLFNTNYGKIINNNCSNNGNGIFLINSNFTTIKSNEISGNGYALGYGGTGLGLSNSCNNSIINNTISHNGYLGLGTGISMGTYSKNNTIEKNNITDNYKNMYLGGCKFNTISENYISTYFGGIGVELYESGNNSIVNNKIIDIYKGIVLQWSDNNTIFNNLIYKCGWYGLGIEQSFNNLVYYNNFTENINGQTMLPLNAEDNNGNNKWDNNSIGNYWDDYNGTDIDDDGIGDIPYLVSGTSDLVDNYPIWDDGIDPPDIIINSPKNNEAFGINAPNFNITVDDENPINTTWYTIDDGLTNYTFSGLIGTINQSAWDLKEYGVINLTFYANDTAGSIGFKNVIIWKDLFAPLITINSPTPNQLCGITAPTFNLQIIEPNLQEKRYSLNGRPNITFTTETQFSQTEWNQVGNGTVSIIFYAIDKVGNTNSSEIIVRKDAYVPDITIYYPLDDEKFGKTPPDYNISIIEEDLVSTWYTIEGVAGTFSFTELTGSIGQDAWDDAPKGEITITFYAVDRAGNIGIESVNVIKRIPSEPAIPGYNLFFLLGILSVVAILISKKIKKS